MSGRDEVRAAIYCRMSLAVLNDTTKVEDQERQCRDVAARNGWEVVSVYADNNKSAWKRSREDIANRRGTSTRAGWNAMLEAVNAGQVSAIISYWGDRLVRQPRDLEDLLDLYETRDIRIASVMGQYDIRNKDHRMMMRWECARACNESDTISQRKKAGLERLRLQGLTRPGGPGGRCFGYEKDGVTIVPGEAGAIRTAARQVLAGQSLGSVARQLAASGVKTTGGQPMTHIGLRRILAYPRMAGLLPDGVSPAAWEPVLDRETWELVQVALSGNQPAANAGRGALSLLSGIAACGACGGPLWTSGSGRNARYAGHVSYKCLRRGCGKVSRSREHLDAYVTGRVIARLANPDNPAAEAPGGDGLAAEILALEGRRAETAAVLEDLADHPGQRPDLLYRAVESFDRRIAELRERAAGDGRERLRRQHQGITREQFAASPLSVRRALVAACFRVVVMPASGRGAGFRAQDVVMEPVRSGMD